MRHASRSPGAPGRVTVHGMAQHGNTTGTLNGTSNDCVTLLSYVAKVRRGQKCSVFGERICPPVDKYFKSASFSTCVAKSISFYPHAAQSSPSSNPSHPRLARNLAGERPWELISEAQSLAVHRADWPSTLAYASPLPMPMPHVRSPAAASSPRRCFRRGYRRCCRRLRSVAR